MNTSLAALILTIHGAAAAAPTALETAMLRTYVHGVDDALAAKVVAQSDLAQLRRLLVDPTFTRRDNVVAFLAHRDGDHAVPALLELLAHPPAGRSTPEEDRALLLVPHALGQLARRGSRVAREALLELAPQESFEDVRDEAQVPLALGEPAGRAGPEVADPSVDAHDLSVSVANHPAVSDPISDARALGVLQEATLKLSVADQPSDVACCVSLSPAAPVQTFGTAGDGLDSIDSSSELNSVLNNPASRVKVVRLINYCGGMGTNILACAFVPGTGIAVVRIGSLSHEASVWAHALGHNTGLVHSSNPQAIMYFIPAEGANLVSQAECDSFHSPNPNAAFVRRITGPCPDDGDGVPNIQDNCPRHPNVDQSDADGDGDGDVCDCRPNDPSVGNCDDSDSCTADVCNSEAICASSPVLPAEVNDSQRLAKAGTLATISWDDAPGPFNVYRGTLESGAVWSYDQVCFAGNLSSGSVDDTQVPAPGGVSFYLVSRVDDCGESGLGSGSLGPRPNTSACP